MSSIGAVLGSVLLVFEVLLLARVVLDWVRVLAPGGGAGLARAREATQRLTEPVIAPVRRVLRPVRVGSMSIDLAFTAVFIAVVLLRGVVTRL
jgi:YggT family protein